MILQQSKLKFTWPDNYEPWYLYFRQILDDYQDIPRFGSVKFHSI